MPDPLHLPMWLKHLRVQGAMPPAQGLVMMAQLGDQTKALAPTLAVLFLLLYALGIVPLTLWCALFLSAAAPIS